MEPTLNLRRDVLHSWLRVAGYTQAELARSLKISEGRVSQLLNSKKEEPSGRLVAALLNVTNLPFERLFSMQPDRTVMERRLKQLTRQRRQRQRQRTSRARPRRSSAGGR